MTLADGRATMLPTLPIEMGGARPGGEAVLPNAGADTKAVLAALGYDEARIAALLESGAVEGDG